MLAPRPGRLALFVLLLLFCLSGPLSRPLTAGDSRNDSNRTRIPVATARSDKDDDDDDRKKDKKKEKKKEKKKKKDKKEKSRKKDRARGDDTAAGKAAGKKGDGEDSGSSGKDGKSSKEASPKKPGEDGKQPKGEGAGVIDLSTPRWVTCFKQGKDQDVNRLRGVDGPFDPTITPEPSRQGLEKLRLSGSSQYSPAGLVRILEKARGTPTIMVDLREEPHGYLNDVPVTFSDANNQVHRGKQMGPAEVMADERARLQAAREQREVDVVQQGKDGQDKIVKIAVSSISTEEELATSKGLQYVRIPITDHLHPDDGDAQAIVNLVRSLPREAWVHCHCRAGKGRTATFMAMMDMMANAKQVSFEVIAQRHAALGGSNLAVVDPKDDDPGAQAGRMEFAKDFHRYCRENSDGFATSWTSWKASRRASGSGDREARP